MLFFVMFFCVAVILLSLPISFIFEDFIDHRWPFSYFALLVCESVSVNCVNFFLFVVHCNCVLSIQAEAVSRAANYGEAST